MTRFRSRIVLPRIALVAATAVPHVLPAQTAASCPAAGPIVAGVQGALRHVRYLADDALEGREVASAAERCAAAYIEAEFAALGLAPGLEGAWEQTFRVRVGAERGTHNLLSVAGTPYPIDEAWVPLGFSGTDMAEGALIARDRGTIEDPHAPAGAAPLTGRIVVIPIERADVDVHYTAAMAARQGAAGVIFRMPAGLPDVASERRPALPLPVAAVTGSASAALAEAATAERPAELMTQVDARFGDARNVVGVLPGTGGPTAPWVVVGAHYDHLGRGGQGSLAPDAWGQIHNGADDNASGTAVLIEVARRMAADPARPTYNVLFLAFSGEERGLWGSGHWVKEPTVRLEDVVAMINMDMVGRLETGSLTIFGAGTAPQWREILERSNARIEHPIGFLPAPDGYGPSDHSSFYGEDIPVLHFFTNTHEDYHRPSDDWERIDGPGLERIADLVAGVAGELAGVRGAPAELTLVSGVGKPTAVASNPEASEEPQASRGYGPYLGSIPDMTPFEGTGVRLTGVREGSPAEKAGIQKGDVIVEFGGREVTDLYTYTYALQDFQPGDAVDIVVLRDGQRVTVKAVLERR